MNGVVDMTPEAISRRTNVPLEIVKHGIIELEKPDPRSRNPGHEGRRIVRLDNHRDWGWMICNYPHYRNLVSEEQRREKTRVRVANLRERQRNGDGGTVTPCNASSVTVTRANASNAMQRQREMEIEKANDRREPGICSPLHPLANNGFPEECLPGGGSGGAARVDPDHPGTDWPAEIGSCDDRMKAEHVKTAATTEEVCSHPGGSGHWNQKWVAELPVPGKIAGEPEKDLQSYEEGQK